MGWITQPYYDQGKAEGMAEGKAVGKAEGKAEGKTEGEAKVLARLLEKRFGAIPTSLRQRIFDANVESLDIWVERAFDAPDLDAVFEAN